MAKIYLTDIDLSQEELKNALLHLSAGIPSGAINGQVWYDTNTKQISYHNGTKAISLINPIEELNLGYSAVANFSSGVPTGGFFSALVVAGTGATSVFGATSTHYPQLGLSTGSTTTGGASVHGNLSAYAMTQGIYQLGGELMLSLLSDATNEFQVFFGLQRMQTATVDISADKYIIFHYARSVYGNHNIRAITKDVSSTITDTGVVMLGSSSPFKLRIVCSAATTVTFYINDSLVATHTTNLPVTTLHPRFAIVKTAGTVSRSAYIGSVWHFARYASLQNHV